jgi:hypothetical protein
MRQCARFSRQKSDNLALYRKRLSIADPRDDSLFFTTCRNRRAPHGLLDHPGYIEIYIMLHTYNSCHISPKINMCQWQLVRLPPQKFTENPFSETLSETAVHSNQNLCLARRCLILHFSGQKTNAKPRGPAASRNLSGPQIPQTNHLFRQNHTWHLFS